MLNRVVTVDFGKKSGRIKPLLCMNGGPRSGGYDLPSDFSDEFSELAVPFVRTSGAAGEYGQNQFVNIHCIFPEWDADPELEGSYNFLPTDLYLASVKNAGAAIFLRLGESPEPYARKLYAKAPLDPEKWASVCEHIIAHYNELWASGFKLGIKYAEIWSGADSRECFDSDPTLYYELYRVTANRLRERFPKLKIGGYGSLGFSSLNRLDAGEEEKGAISFMQKFLAYIRAEATKAPLDFFSWDCYTSNPDELAMHAKYARTYLDTAGFRKTRSFVSSFGPSKKSTALPALRPDYPSELCASLILAQKSSIDMMMYSTADAHDERNGLFSVEDFRTHRRYAAYNAALAFGKLYKLGTALETTGDYRKEVYAPAATDGSEAAILATTRNYQGKLEIVLKDSSYTACTVVKTAPGGERGQGVVYRAENVPITGGKIIIPVKQNEIYFVTLFGSL